MSNPAFSPFAVTVPGTGIGHGTYQNSGAATYSPDRATEWGTAEQAKGAMLTSFGIRVGLLLDVLAAPGDVIALVQRQNGEQTQSGYSFPEGTGGGSTTTKPVVGTQTLAANLRRFTPSTERGMYALAMANLARELGATAVATPATQRPNAGFRYWRSAGFLDPMTLTAVLVVALIVGVLYVEEQADVQVAIATRQAQVRHAQAASDHITRAQAVRRGEPDPGPTAAELAVRDEVRQRAEREHDALRDVRDTASDVFKYGLYAAAIYVAAKLIL